MVQSIATATEQQSAAVDEVSSSMENVSSTFAVNREAVGQINQATNDLARISSDLINVVSWFKTDASSNKTTGTAADSQAAISSERHEFSMTDNEQAPPASSDSDIWG